MKKFYFLLFLSIAFHARSQAQATLVKPMRLFSYLYPVGNKLLFFGNNDADPYSSNFELWATDGTTAGTTLVQDIYPGVNGSIPDQSVWDDGSGNYRPLVMNNILYFVASSPTHYFSLWRSDGTAAGTYAVVTGMSFSGPYGFHFPFFCQLNNVLYFSAYGSGGSELWRSDGTAGGTYRVKDISPMYDSEPSHLIAFKGAVYFAAMNENSGNEIWRTDGTEAGTTLFKDYFTGLHGIMDNNNGGKILPWFTISGNYLYFIGNTDTSSYQPRLFRTDGTAAGTIQLSDDILPQELTDVNGTLFFYGYSLANNTSSLYRSDGTSAGTVAIAVNNNITAFPGDYQYRTSFHAFKNKLYFPGAQVEFGVNKHFGIYESDGTTAGTVLRTEMPLHSEAHWNTDYINDPTNSSFLWRSLIDIGTTVSDYRIAQMDGATNNYKIYYGASATPVAAFLDGDLYFEGRDTSVCCGGFGLYKVHPTLASTPLPLTWLSFDVLLNDAKEVDLHWQTASESNNKGFSIERSTDGQNYSPLHWTDGAGTSSTPRSYAWTDQHPMPGKNFYRLQQVDLDGKSSYSAIKEADLSAGDNTLVIAPNPVTGSTLTIRHHLAPGKVFVKITDLSGRIMSTHEYTITGNTLSCDLQLLRTGMYHMEITDGTKRLGSALFVKTTP